MKHLKKFNEHKFCPEYDYESQEYMDLYGFELGKTFLFAPYQSDDDGGFGIVICPKSYWDNKKHCYDGSIDGVLLDMPSGFGEASESDFEYDGSLTEAIDKLIDDGFKFDPNLQIFIENSSESYGQLHIDGDTITEYITKTYL